jgi:serine/threonine-protein kinase RsbW
METGPVDIRSETPERLPGRFKGEKMLPTHKPSLFSQVSDYGAYAELRQMLSSEIRAISPAIDQTLDFIAERRNADGSEICIEVALREALANAVVHGNREHSSKHVFVRCSCTRNGDVLITVQDEGQGFASDTVPDPTTPENRLRTSGRGIYLIKALMDAIRFDEKGTVVHMFKRSNAPSAAEGGTRLHDS